VKIALRGMGSGHLIRRLEGSGLMDLVGGSHDDLFFDATWPSDELARFLRSTARLGSFDLNPWMRFTRADISRARFLRLRTRKVIEDSSTDYARMRAHMDGLPWIGDDPMYRCRIPERVSLTRIRLKPNQIASVGQWTAEFIVPNAVRRIFEKEEFTGAAFRSVTDTRTEAPFDAVAHLYSNHVLAPRIIDVASRKIVSAVPEERGYDALGCFCYEPDVLQDALDFNRTGEGNVGFEFPDWVVSARVRDVYVVNKLKGWAFEPVLEPASETYDDYTALWHSLYELLSDCRSHTLRGQTF
jgi:hypothetical protein